jgi:flagellar hook protein FlgE
MASLYVPLTGLESSSDALSVTSNNLANLNTIGFKTQRPLFADLFYQQIGTSGDGDAEQLGVGTKVQAVDSEFTQGSIEASGVPTDVAIQGDGFFVVQQNGQQLYTRAGDFSTDQNGNLLTQDGAQVLGYSATNGVINAGAALGPLNIDLGQTTPANPTANVMLALNLDSDTPIGGTFSSPVEVYDSLGGSHILTYNFTKTAANTWSYAITIPAADVTGAAAPVTLTNGTGSLTFNGAGVLTGSGAGAAPPAADVTGISVPGTLADGANTLTFSWNTFTATGTSNVTQVSGPSATTSTIQDGYASGTLTSYQIGSDGTISGTFSNDQTLTIGQVALASFENDQGLIRNGENNFQSSLSSGQANVGVPGSGGRGTLSGGSLEESNVDIATQFANLIIEERDYQANAKSVTTIDQVTQAAIALIP